MQLLLHPCHCCFRPHAPSGRPPSAPTIHASPSLTHAQAETLVKKAQETMDRERALLETEMRKELGRLVARTTEKVVGRVLTPQDEERLQKEAVAQVAR